MTLVDRHKGDSLLVQELEWLIDSGRLKNLGPIDIKFSWMREPWTIHDFHSLIEKHIEVLNGPPGMLQEKFLEQAKTLLLWAEVNGYRQGRLVVF